MRMSQRIFIVDDNPSFVEALKTVLQKYEEFDVVGAASNGEEAIPLLIKYNPNILIVDIEMPRVDGPALIRTVKKDFPDTKVLVVSQSAVESRILELIELQIDGHVVKVDPTEQVIEALIEVSKNGRYFSNRLGQKYFDILRERNFAQPPAMNELKVKPISERELEVVKLVALGLTNKEVAQRLDCSENTIKTHKANVMRKIGAKNSNEMSRWFFAQEMATNEQ
jgi:DNA-binding NarL/FixJ family response regulator